MTAATVATAEAPDSYPEGFELDGNLIFDGAMGADWASLFDVTGTNEPTIKATQPAGFRSSTFQRDFIPGSTADTTTFTTGSKDTLELGVVPGGKSAGWQCSKSNNIGAKVDLLNTYATAYLDPTSKDTIVYFGLETASNEGTRNAGFWFLIDGTVSCEAQTGKAANFAGNHTDGDILVTSEYTGTGGVSLIKVFKWQNGGLTEIASGADCKDAPSNATVCGSTNGAALRALRTNPDNTETIEVPWLVETKSSNPSEPGLTSADLDRGQFFEAGLNLTRLGLSACFGKYLANTRSSATPNATLFDFAVGEFSTCSIAVSKSCTVTDFAPSGSGKLYTTAFSAQIENTGGATIPAGTIVTYVDDAGTENDTNDDVTITKALASDLVSGAKSAMESGSFLTNMNPPTNTIRAQVVFGSGSAETVIKADPFSIQCTKLDIVSAISVTKNCGLPNGTPALALASTGSSLEVVVNVSGQVCYDNTAVGAQKNVPYLDVTAQNLLGQDPMAPKETRSLLLTKDGKTGSSVTLEPGDCATYVDSYKPESADGSTSPASNAKFSDTVQARGTHPVLSEAVRDAVSEQCVLCPCIDC